MSVSVEGPADAQGTLIGEINRRGGSIVDSKVESEEGGYFTIEAEVGLSDMFGFSQELRSLTQGRGAFSMEFLKYSPTMPNKQAQLVKAFEAEQASKRK